MQPEKKLAAAIMMVCAGVSMPAMTMAQTAESNTNVGQNKVVEQVIVTGSRVKRPEFEGNIPGVQTDAEQIEIRNFDNAIDVLNDIPLVGGGATPNGTNGGQPSSLGASFVDLLELGTARTLTLINGRRAVSGNAGSLFVAGNETGTQVDVNVIPTDLIERVDVLTVGGAVAYGSDAIAGVVNYILKDDFEGMRVSLRGAQTARGDGTEMSARSTFGTNFDDNKGNVFAHVELIDSDGLQANSRSFRNANGGAVTSFLNGSVRNPNFDTSMAIGANNSAFFSGATDGVSNTANLPFLSSANISPGGTIFNFNPGTGNGLLPGSMGQVGPFARTFTVNNTQLLGGTPGQCNPGGAVVAAGVFCNFAPTALPTGVMPADVFAAFGVTPPAGLTAGQLSALAVNVIQDNRPTARELFAQNPNIPLNAFLGTFLGAFPDIANTDPATRALLPRIAVPIRFRNDGTIEQFNVATLQPDTPSTLGGAVGGDGFNPIFNTTLRVAQERAIGFFGGHYDITDNLTFFSENTYARVESESLRGGASANNANSSTIENAALLVSVQNPFLTSANRAALQAAGIGPNDSFVVSRTNQDIQGDNGQSSENKTFRTVQGLKGDFEFLDRTFDWDAAVTYGRVKQETRLRQIKDIEYALAVDAVVDPADGQIKCRAQVQGPYDLAGVSQNITRLPGPDGIPTERLDPAVVRPTAAQIAACQPLNPFGFNQMSAASREYVLGRQKFSNENEQRGAQANLAFPIVTLPAGDLGFGASFEYREDEIDFSVDQLSQNGRTRTAAIAQTRGETQTTEYGAEVRVPIFGGDWTFPGLYALDIGGGVRRTEQDGDAPTFRDIAGQLVTQKTNGEPQDITTIKANWSPIPSLRFRGERTRAVRQPNVVELFLGGQPAFNAANDPCGVANIGAGANPATRRANCIADVIAKGAIGANGMPITNEADAATFLQGFIPTGNANQGTFAGSPSLSPEKADSFTAGLVFTPTFLRGLRASADYISIDLKDIIFPTTQTQALQFCFDSAKFPNNAADFKVNTCGLTRRSANFQLDNGFTLGFLNLAAQELRALNGTLDYTFDVGDLFGGGDWGQLNFNYNHYHLFAFRESASGNFDDTTDTAGSIGRPRNESRLATNWNRGPLTVQLTWQYTDHTTVFNGGAPATIEALPVLTLPSYSLYDLSVAYRWDKYRANFTMINALDKNVLGSLGGGILLDSIGRRFALTFSAAFE
jgi:outer membrane receptor protein involved in Fe transport